MKRKKRATTGPLICLTAALVAPAAMAQDETQARDDTETQVQEQTGIQAQEPARDDNQGGDGAQQQRSAAELVTDYLAQDIFLQPGVGLDAVKVGMPFEQVLRTWGPPSDEGRDKLVSKKWTYNVADHTTITLIGNDDVDIMRVTGSFNSPYVTADGASFGMAQHQLATIYGAAESDGDRVTYERRGIGFVLDRGQVVEIRVFSPKN